MLFHRCLLFVATACVAVSIAIPLPDAGDSLSSRELSDSEMRFATRALSKADVGKHANAALKTQSKKPLEQQKKAQANKKVTDKISKPKTPGYSKMNQEDRKAADAANTKEHTRLKDQAVTKNQQQNKADRTAKWDAQKKTPYTKTPKAPGAPKAADPSKAADKKQVKDTLSGAAQRMKDTKNIPGRKDEFSVGDTKVSGKDTRKAVMNSHLNEPVPVGRGDNKNPKPFRNDPYSSTHGDESLRGQRPIAGNPAGLKEYPVTKNGYTGSGAVGPARVITSNQGGKDEFHGVIGHDPKKGGDKDDHYLATHKKAKRELFDEFEYEY